MLQHTIERPVPAQFTAARAVENQLQREHHESLVREAHKREMQEAKQHIRVLLHREQWYAVRTTQLATVLAHTLRRYAKNEAMSPERVAYAVLVTFDARCHAGDLPHEGHAELGRRCAAKADQAKRAGGADGASTGADVHAVAEALSASLGQQCRVTGWLPGVVIMDGKVPVSLTGDACPSCDTNPLVYKYTGSQTRGRTYSRCLNREDCGWSARPKSRKNQKKKKKPSRDRIDS